jgi:spore germination protein YaaH
MNCDLSMKKGFFSNLLLMVYICMTPLRAEENDPSDGLYVGVWTTAWDPPSSMESLDSFNEVNPFAMALDERSLPFTVHPGLLKDALQGRPAGGIVVPVVVNDVVSGGRIRTLKSDRSVSRFLSDPRLAARHLECLLSLSRGFDGIEIDYERIPPSLWGRFGRFIEALGKALKANGKKLYVDLEPGFFRRGDLMNRYGPGLVRDTDGIKLMAYYERSAVSFQPGSGSSLAWVLETVQLALKVVPPEKLTVSLSLAGTEWVPVLTPGFPLWKGKHLHYGRVMELLSERNAEILWDGGSLCPYFYYVHEGIERKVWFENERSLAEKIRAVRSLGVRRFCFWYWGRRHPRFSTLGLSPH